MFHVFGHTYLVLQRTSQEQLLRTQAERRLAPARTVLHLLCNIASQQAGRQAHTNVRNRVEFQPR
jgi:hypothetical protein